MCGNTNSNTIFTSMNLLKHSPFTAHIACVYICVCVKRMCRSKRVLCLLLLLLSPASLLIQRTEIRYQIIVRFIVFDSNRRCKPYVLTNENECLSPTERTIYYWYDDVGLRAVSIDTNNEAKRKRLTIHNDFIRTTQSNTDKLARVGIDCTSEWFYCKHFTFDFMFVMKIFQFLNFFNSVNVNG